MAESRMVRGEQRWFAIALGIVVLLGLVYVLFNLFDEPVENVETPTAPAAEAPAVAPSP